MKAYIVKSIHMPFEREWSIFDDLVSLDKDLLIEKVRQNLEKLSFEKVELRIENDNLIVNNETEKWLIIKELELIN